MHPILFRIPLPKTQIPALYVYLAVIALGLIYAAAMWFARKDKANAVLGLVVAGVGVVGKFGKVLENLLKDPDITLPEGMIPVNEIPIYSYGVMLGLSLVVGWYLTLGLAKRDGLPQETMANNYVITAVAAIAGSRILYVLTNLNEFSSPVDIFALRRGGLVAYGGFLGGFLGSLIYLRRHRIPLLPWADVAVPSLASGLMITRIGCYLFGCDFGRPLEATAPEWLKGLGSFPRWAPGLLHEGNPPEGAPAWTQHVKNHLINDSATTSLPVHPTQLYESLVGAGLLALLLYARTKQKFRGQIFLLFTFAYGVCRYMLEILRDDEERGSLPFSAGKDTMIALGLAIFAVGFALGFSKLIKNETMRRLSIVLAFVPAVVMYLALAPASFGESVAYQWSTSQFVGITTGFAACVAFSVFYRAALAHPEAAMRIPLPAEEGGEGEPEDADKVADADDEDEDEDEKDEEIVDAELAEKAPAKKGAKKASSKDEPKARAGAKGKAAGKPVKRAAKKPAAKPADDEDDDDAKASDDDASNDAKVGSSKAAARDDGDADDGDDDGEDKKS